ncbi:aliphatic sulfonates import ATP-binding protein SsuB [Clostridium saccharobutylicum]|uniref:ABC transporter ATP-binding protein n=1 Tax=Clostridium saccharobutylicum TaxID=169679 RepID=UPI000983E2AF|nr:ABC transporter ATP-binding protein [Clostridium saccharobutylicum]AQS10287.1 aliphatic sulfonates import ATP-binding protein SsuB [Clostridium saccharobutylicum]MBC2436553.1 ABC transporter ATP-binding protein [Clostridium saccharobutylicum]NSB87685.1 ABC-type nitrate/sulfonate/bicarbonate transport system ATPase subunit [Clostridium saccharobutylicum]NYC31221.1 ABC-type nitrate/sulfonate/bicarbonate transport system ATPase subunit [Clostridium saccharobutylicum]OOM17436.1 aliphatic sulfon
MNSYQNKIQITKVKKSFGNMEILRDITFNVGEGELISIVGPSGSGKSTIFNIITKIIDKDDGDIVVNGDVSYMYQKDMMVPWKKVIDNIGIPLVFKGHSKKEARGQVLKYLDTFGLDGFEYKYPSQLSGGMKQRANFLKTFLTSKDIMLLDEPFAALDSITRRKMQKWLLDLTKEMKTTILFITHDIEEAIFLSDRIYVISEKPATIKGEIKVNLSYPREEDIVTDVEFVRIRREVLDLFKA